MRNTRLSALCLLAVFVAVSGAFVVPGCGTPDSGDPNGTPHPDLSIPLIGNNPDLAGARDLSVPSLPDLRHADNMPPDLSVGSHPDLATGCSANTANCDNNPANGCETNLANDPNHCGSCKAVCPSVANGLAGCSSGLCGIAGCNLTYADCNSNSADGCEIALASDPNNCGRCSHACPFVANGTAGCSAGVCAIGGCNPGYADCNRTLGDGCEIDRTSDPANCGACGNACAANLSCCQSACTDISSDATNCGGCGNACAAGVACLNGSCNNANTCVPACAAGGTCTNGVCVPPSGGCTPACPAGSSCLLGVCLPGGGCNPPCAAGHICVIGTCI